MIKSHLTAVNATHDFVNHGQKVIQVELAAIERLLHRLNDNFNKACQLILETKGHIIVLGIGKSGHIGHKIAATLASTGTPAFFVHPGEANHGDLGMVTSRDLVIAISNSGEATEILTLLPMLKRLGTHIISLTGNPHSSLARNATVNLDISVEKEACPLGLTPTASSTVTLVMGDALAIALLHARGFSEHDFAFSHPGGALGRRLLIRVSDIMHTGKAIPYVPETATLSEALIEMTAKGLGITAIVDSNNHIQGVFTDGDLRRTLSKNVDVHTTLITLVMTRNCITVRQDMLAAEALQLMENRKINALLVANDENKLVGVFNMHDLLMAKVF